MGLIQGHICEVSRIPSYLDTLGQDFPAPRAQQLMAPAPLLPPETVGRVIIAMGLIQGHISL